MTTKAHNLPKVVYIAFSFMVLFSAFGITQNLISTIYKNLGFLSLGQICILMLYVVNTIGNMVVPHFKNKFSIKTGLVTGGSTYVLFILCGTFTVFCKNNDYSDSLMCSPTFIYPMNILFAIFIGLGASILWFFQSQYVNDCADGNNHGKYHGIFFSVMLCSLLIGSSMAAFILNFADELSFFIVLSIVSSLSIVLFLFLPPVAPKQTNTRNNTNYSLIESIQKLLFSYQNPHHYPVIASSFLGGLTASTAITYFPMLIRSITFVESNNIANQRVALVLMAFGVGQILAGFLVGPLLDKFSKVKIGCYIFSMTELVSILSLFTGIMQSYQLAFLTGFLWGANDSSVKTFNNTLISSNYEGKFEVFAMSRATQCIGIVFGSLCNILFADRFGNYYMLWIVCLQLSCHVVFYLTSKNSKPKELEIELLPIEISSSLAKKC